MLEIVKTWLDLPDAAVKQLPEDGADLSRAALVNRTGFLAGRIP
jgi:hypothetical protein